MRAVPAFHAVEIDVPIAVDLAVGRATHVELRGDPDVLANITTRVEDGVLQIRATRPFHARHALHAQITTPALTALAVDGVAQVRATGISSKAFDLAISGVGSVVLSGTTGALSAVLSGSGELEARTLVAADATVQLSGTGEATVHATRAATVAISGAGTVNLFGHPKDVTKSVTGIGRVVLK